MTETPKAPRSQSWLGPVVVALLAAQLGLIWVQGGLLHRQHQAIQGLRGDIQSLSESIELGEGVVSESEEGGFVPAHGSLSVRRRARLTRATHISLQDEQAEQTARDLEASRKSAEKAVKEAQEVQQKLSWEENARKAEEKAKIEKAQIKKSALLAYWLPVLLLLVIATGVTVIAIRIWSNRRD